MGSHMDKPQPKFKIGDHVTYPIKKLQGVVMAVFETNEIPEYRYFVRTKSWMFSVSEQDLQMSESAKIIPIKSTSKTPQNDDPGAA